MRFKGGQMTFNSKYESCGAANKSRRAVVLCATASALAILTTFANQASAQNAATQAPLVTPPADGGQEIVVVSSIRKSMMNAQQLKENSDTFLDAITAQDIGALPDNSVTEALQRIPGVAISHFAAANDPNHFSAEGSDLVVQGLNNVRSEFNGRDAFSASANRGLSFSDVPAELLGAVEVHKSPSADMIEGGLAGTINLVTRLPFDTKGMSLAFSAQDNYSDFAARGTPGGSLLFSDRWNTDIGEFGVLASASYSKVMDRADGTTLFTFGPTSTLVPGKQVYVPEGAGVQEDNYDHQRMGTSFALQYRSPDKTLDAQLQYLTSNSIETWTEYRIYNNPDAVPNAAQGIGTFTTPTFLSPDQFTYGGNNIFQSGTLNWQEQNWTGTPYNNGNTVNMSSRAVKQDYATDDLAFKANWKPNDSLKFTVDLQHVQSRTTDMDVTADIDIYAATQIQANGTSAPSVTFHAPIGAASGLPVATDTAWFSNPKNYYARDLMDHFEYDDGEENAAKFDAEYKVDAGWLESVKVGARFALRDQTDRIGAYNWGNLSEVWGSPVTPTGTYAPNAPGSNIIMANINNLERGQVAAPLPVAEAPFFNANSLLSNYAQINGEAAAIKKISSSASYVPSNMRPGVEAGSPFLPTEIVTNHEVTDAGYAMARFGDPEFAAFGHTYDISGNIGFRMVYTDLNSAGGQGFPIATSINTTTPAGYAGYCAAQQGTPSALCSIGQSAYNQVVAYDNGYIYPVSVQNRYWEPLPSLNLKVGIQDDMLVRFALARTIERGNLGDLRNGLSIAPMTTSNNWVMFNGQPGWTGIAGNPNLKPESANQADLSYEWYFTKDSSITVSTFYKQVHHVVVESYSLEGITNNGITMPVFVQTPVNSSGSGNVKGVEFAYSQFFRFLPEPFDGLGFQGSYTHLTDQGIPNYGGNLGYGTGLGGIANLGTIPAALGGITGYSNAKVPLVGLSNDNVSLTGIYEKGDHSFRLAYTWRSRYLLTTQDAIFPYTPIYSDSYGQLDASYFYSVTPQVKVGFPCPKSHQFGDQDAV